MEKPIKDFEQEELKVWGRHTLSHFTDILNGEVSIETAREDLSGFRNTKHYTGTNDKYLPPDI